jgi:pimeloyl-ACP methyl ester carboxylesterase
MNATLTVPAGKVKLQGELIIPDGAKGIVLFAHGSGSSRLSPRNRHIAEIFNGVQLATLLFDLLTDLEYAEDRFSTRLHFDIKMLAERLGAVTEWIATQQGTRSLPLGYFGASTGSAAAMISAAEYPQTVKAVVSRGGRPDLARDSLPLVKTPTLLIVGEYDFDVIDLNSDALQHINADKDLQIVSGATHLFYEKGKLEEVANFATKWFAKYLKNGTGAEKTD